MKLVVVKNEQQTNIYQTEKNITNMDVCQWIVKKKKKKLFHKISFVLSIKAPVNSNVQTQLQRK